MLEIDDSPGFLRPALEYFLQLLVVCPVVMLAGAVLSPLLSVFGLSGEYPTQIHFAGYRGIVCLFSGIAVGWMTERKVPTLVPIGRWIWVLPAVVVLPEMVREVFGRKPVPWLPEMFFANSGNEGIGVFLFLLPVCSVAGYSLGMTLVGKQSKWAISVAGVALFSILGVCAHRFEHSRIEEWSKIRTVIDRPGLSLSQDASGLCATRTSSGSFLQNGTMVEGLELRTCFNGRLLDDDTARPADAWTIERVRVLNGDNHDAEGWVLGYGLRAELER